MFRVIKHFTDLQDGNFAYFIGDTFPREGMSVLPSRIKELASDKNRQGEPLIIEVEEPKKKAKSVDKAEKK